MNIGEALRFAERSIERIDAQYLLADLLGMGRASLIAHAERALSEWDETAFTLKVLARAQGKPVAYLIGKREFYGRDFAVNEHVLIPRPETEFLVEQALARLSGRKWPGDRANAGVLDLGTGSGAIAVTLVLESPESRVTACDVSSSALETARANAAALGAAVEIIESNWYSALGDRRFDLIVSNPPYVAGNDTHLSQGDLRFEPQTALTDGSHDGLQSLRDIIAGAPSHLHPGGWLLFEHGYDQAATCRDLLLKHGFNDPICIRDLAGIPRVAGGRIR